MAAPAKNQPAMPSRPPSRSLSARRRPPPPSKPAPRPVSMALSSPRRPPPPSRSAPLLNLANGNPSQTEIDVAPTPSSTRGRVPPPIPTRSISQPILRQARPAPPPGRMPASEGVEKLSIAAYLEQNKPEWKCLPMPTRLCIQFLVQPRFLQEEGLFRIPGSRTAILAKDKLLLASSIDEASVFEDVLDPAIVAGLLKMLLARHHTATGISRTSQEILGKGLDTVDMDLQPKHIHDALMLIEASDQRLLKAMMWLLLQVVQNDDNRMSVKALSTSVGPSLFCCLSTGVAQRLLKTLLNHPLECLT
eukprot:m.81862 g.81862  ORF g.81862 m.81862 type:complete len:305 (-) comp14586_c0_seq2:774-1688(-)